MLRTMIRIASAAVLGVAAAAIPGGVAAQAASSEDPAAACAALADARDLTLLTAEIRETPDGIPYCYARGIIPPAIGFHVQLPLPEDWNGRFLMWGDGGKD